MLIKNKNILITGGAGFIGSSIAEKLHKNNKIFILDNLTTGNKKNISDLNVDFRQGDIAQVIKIIPEKIDIIMHLGMSSSTTLYLNNKSLIASQINGSIQIFQKAIKDRAKLIIASSSSLYNKGKIPSIENQRIQVTDFYTECRFCVERLAQLFSDLYDMNVIILRMFSVYGGKRELDKKNFANMIVKFMLKIKQGQNPVIYETGIKKIERDFIFIDDVVACWLTAVGYKKEKFNIFNVGTGKKYNFNDVLKIINKTTGTRTKLEYEPNPLPNLVMKSWANMTKTQNELNFIPRYDLEEGILKTWNFIVTNKTNY